VVTWSCSGMVSCNRFVPLAELQEGASERDLPVRIV
jgi:hypothetical protein